MALPGSEETNSLNELQRKLDQGTLTNVRLKRSNLPREESAEGDGWSRDIIDDYSEEVQSSSWRKIKNFLIIATVFFIVSLGIASIVILRGGNLISNANINLDVRGPVSIKSGDILHLQVGVVNHNKVSLELARVLVEYPDGTRSAIDATQNFIRGNYSIGIIKKDEVINQSFDALVFGGQGNQQKVKVTLEYRLAGSNNVFSKEKDFIYSISDAPVTMAVDLPSEMNAGREFNFTIDLVSNSPTILSDLILDVSFPPGFQFKSSDIPPAPDGHTWRLGDLASGAKKKITVTGFLSGQENEAKSFRFVVGPAEGRVGTQTAFAYGDVLKNLVIRNPFVGADLVINNDSGSEIVASAGDILNGQINWTNNLVSSISNLQVELKIDGNVINLRSIRADRGFYRSQDNKIIWNKDLVAGMETITPNSKGGVSFSFSVLPLSSLRSSSVRNPQTKLTLVLTGERQTTGNQSEVVRTEIEKTLKVLSVPQLATQLLYSNGPFTNSGPINPKVNESSTYTVTWSVANPYSEIKDARVTASLPVYVNWQSTISPQDEKLTYNQATRQITWDLGTLPAGLGFGSNPREVSFQIALTPSLGQVGETPVVVTEAVLTGTDSFANTEARFSRAALSTRHLNEPGKVSGVGVVSE
ncbi:MAG: hypothetical protein WCW56_01335 [Candidatus Paceibacterota bacterium]|jgi:hypothetical protein